MYIGLKTAYDPALDQMRKGYTQKDEYEQLERIQNAGMDYNALLMLGVAGRGNYKDNAEATVDLLNTFKPKIVGPLTTSIQKPAPLYDMKLNGEFVEATEREMILEELILLENLEMDDDCFFFGSHPYNLIRFSNTFKNRDKMVEDLMNQVAKIDEMRPGILDAVLPRGSSTLLPFGVNTTMVSRSISPFISSINESFSLISALHVARRAIRRM